jgi:hypothetical protein
VEEFLSSTTRYFINRKLAGLLLCMVPVYRRQPTGARTSATASEMRLNIVILIAAHLICETAEVLSKLWPSLLYSTCDPFINYKWPWPEYPLYTLAFVKMITDSVAVIMIVFVIVRIAWDYSPRLRGCALCLLGYHLIDHFMLWYNYRTGHALYWAMGFAMIGCIVSMFIKENNPGKIRRIA